MSNWGNSLFYSIYTVWTSENIRISWVDYNLYWELCVLWFYLCRYLSDMISVIQDNLSFKHRNRNREAPGMLFATIMCAKRAFFDQTRIMVPISYNGGPERISWNACIRGFPRCSWMTHTASKRSKPCTKIIQNGWKCTQGGRGRAGKRSTGKSEWSESKMIDGYPTKMIENAGFKQG